MELWPVTIRARQSLLATFEGFDDADWEVPSLCDGWTTRQVLAHLILSAQPPPRRYLAAVARARSFDKANHSLAVIDAQRPTDQLLQGYRDVLAKGRPSPPGWMSQAAPLWDIVLHTYDVRIPLGLETEVHGPDLEPVLRLLFSRLGRAFIFRGRPAVRWVATDHEWSRGTGPEVRGTMADLALAASGRGARVAQLEGDGVPVVAAWLA